MAQSKRKFVRLRDLLVTGLPALFLVIGAFWATLQFVQPAVPNKLTIAAASKGSPYYALAERSQRYMARNGVTLEIKETSGSLENMKLLNDATSGVTAAFVKGGLAGGKLFAHGTSSCLIVKMGA